MLESVEKPESLTEALHLHLIDLLRSYNLIGGMPEAVLQYVQTGNLAETRRIQEEIINSYVLDFVKHAVPTEIPKLTQVWNSIPKHLAKENKKFIFSAVNKSARAREYENALTWLQDTGLIYRVKAVRTPKFPLAYYADNSSFKIYVLDVGLLGAMASTPVELLARGKSSLLSIWGLLWKIMLHNNLLLIISAGFTIGEAKEEGLNWTFYVNWRERFVHWKSKSA